MPGPADWRLPLRSGHLCIPAAVPYVSNSERIRLGLQAWGSDVPQPVIDAAVRELHLALPEVAPEDSDSESEVAPKRARNRRGQFRADDITTPEKDEAWEEAEATGAAEAEVIAEAEAMAEEEAAMAAALEYEAAMAAEAEAASMGWHEG